ncbi:MAG: cyclic pyranopterin monophosphate synthase MoaC, partial [Flavobacteriaceae bacterium]|nr:cyclic pyranopterin monophosphate synthase MoaC [Flavobacteriaceae bacterium]
MVNVGDKAVTKRKAIARGVLFLGDEIMSHFSNDEINTKKGPVF